MKSITKIIETETGHRLTNYPAKCAHLHGHRYVWEVTVTAAELDDIGFIMDYGDLKDILKKTVDGLDHAFIMHCEDPIVKTLGQTEARRLLRATNGQPARLYLTSFNPTSENIIGWMAEILIDALPDGIELTYIKMWETSSSYCEWRNDDIS